MPKRFTTLALATVLLLSLLTACGEMPLETTASSSTLEPTEATKATEPTEATEPPYVPLPTEESRPAQPTEDPIGPEANTADKPNTENGVYASCGNYYYTMYLDWNKEEIQFYLLTEKPLPSGSKIVTNLKSNHWTYIMECELPTMSMEARVFADWKGADMDWAAYWKASETYYNALFDYKAGKCDYNTLLAAYHADLAHYEITKEYRPAYNQAVNDWKAGNPFFHAYEVTIYLTGYTMDESLTQVELVAGDMSRTIPVGEIRLREKRDPSTIETNKLTMKDRILAPSLKNEANTLSFPWSSGILEMKWDFVAQRDMTLTDAYFFANGGEGCKIVGAEMQITMTDGKRKALGQPRVVTWTPGTPLEVKKNEQVECRVYYEDPRTQMADYGAKHYMVLEYICEGSVGKVLSASEKCLRKWNDWFNQYLWAFTDYDFMVYYEEYVWPYNQYMEACNYRVPAMPNAPAG